MIINHSRATAASGMMKPTTGRAASRLITMRSSLLLRLVAAAVFGVAITVTKQSSLSEESFSSIVGLQVVEAFIAKTATIPSNIRSPTQFQFRHTNRLIKAKSNDGDFGSGGGSSGGDDDNGEELTLQDDDWRAFRAKLVMNEKRESTTTAAASTTKNPGPSKTSTSTSTSSFPATIQPSSPGGDDDVDELGDLDGIGSLFQDSFVDTVSNATPENSLSAAAAGAASSKSSSASSSSNTMMDSTTMTPLDPSQWAYHSGDVIEQGAVILGGVEQDFGFGLRQQYFHKTAILVLDHSNVFTKGIILNRPTDLTLEDDVNPGLQWRVWFGGDVQGIHDNHPDIVCLHSLKNERASKASIKVMKDIQWTTFSNAKKLVKAGAATVKDFWCFVGYAGWGPGQLKGELDRSSWLMVATDSGTLLKELARQSEGADPRDAGLDTWTLLMKMIGREATALKNSGDFDDLMLKEWARKNLLSEAAGGGAGRQLRDPQEFNANPELVETMLKLLGNRSGPPLEGCLVRASSAERSPFLLENQEFHKSVVLILKDEDAATVGVILNRPSAQGVDIKVQSAPSSIDSRVVKVPLRFGGQYNVQGAEPLLWLHCSETLRQANIGSPISPLQTTGIYKCTANDVMKAVASQLAKPHEFLCISGVSVWPKVKDGSSQGMEGAIEMGDFELVPSSACDTVWSMLKKEHNVLTRSTLKVNLALSEETWSVAASRSGQSPSSSSTSNGRRNNILSSMLEPLKGLGEHFDEEDDSVVFNTDYKVGKLSDDALRSWCATFLLGIHDYKSSS